MKKLVAILFVLALVAMLPLSAFAATGVNEFEQAILDKLDASKVMGSSGWSFEVPQEYINSAKNYFAGDCDMSAAEKDKILSYIDQGMAIVKKEADAQKFSGTEYNLSKMGEAARAEVLSLGQEACAEIDLNLTYSPTSKQVTITPEDSKTPIFESSPVVKTTGQDFPVDATVVGAAIAVVVVMGTAVMFAVSKKNGLLVK